MQEISLGILANGPHAQLIQDIASQCVTDTNIRAIWVGGSLASGNGDIYSDIDFRIAVEPQELDKWITPNWEQYLPIQPAGATFMRFGDKALLHHLVLADGTIVDFYVQDTTHQNFEPQLVIIACRDDAFRKVLESAMRPAAKLEYEVDAHTLRQFLVDYWITTHKQMKALARKYDYSPFVGLYYERLALLRAWYIQKVGRDVRARATLHMLGVLHNGLRDTLTQQQQDILGLPSRTPEETVIAIEAIREEMATNGRWLAQKYAFEYPFELETVVQSMWKAQKESFMKR